MMSLSARAKEALAHSAYYNQEKRRQEQANTVAIQGGARQAVYEHLAGSYHHYRKQ